MAMQTIKKSVTWGETGKTLYATVKSDGTQVRARSSSGIVEWPTASGCYELSLSLDTTKSHQIAWDDGTDFTSEDFVLSSAGGGAKVLNVDINEVRAS